MMRTAIYSLLLAGMTASASASVECGATWKESIGNPDFEWISEAVEILDQTTESVTFSVSQNWVDPGTPMFAVHYRSVEGNEEVCDMTTGEMVMPYEESKEYTATCSHGKAEVGIYLYVGDNGHFVAEECEACKAPDDDYVGHYITIPCEYRQECHTEAPSASPSASPSAVHSAEPTETPDRVLPPGEDCVPRSSEIDLKEVLGNSKYQVTKDIITVVSQNVDEVTVTVTQDFAADVKMLSVSYHEPDTNELECEMETGMHSGDDITVTAQCHMGFSELTVYLYVGDADYDKDECEACALTNEVDYAAYYFVIPCIPVCKPEVPDCFDGALLTLADIEHEPVCEWEDEPILMGGMNGDHVEFTVLDKWDDKVTSVSISYTDALTGEPTCQTAEDGDYHTLALLQAKCVDDMATVVVNIHSEDIDYQAGQIDSNTCSLPGVIGTCAFEFVLPCDSSKMCGHSDAPTEGPDPTPPCTTVCEPEIPDCFDDALVTLADIEHEEVCDYESNPIVMGEMTNENVKFTVIDTWPGDAVTSLSVSYKSARTDQVICETFGENGSFDTTELLTAVCEDDVASVVVSIYSSEIDYKGDNIESNTCDLTSLAEDVGTCSYKFVLPCDSLKICGNTATPTAGPTEGPSSSPSKTPTASPSSSPSKTPSASPTLSPSDSTPTPTNFPTQHPSFTTEYPSAFPSGSPSGGPSISSAPTGCFEYSPPDVDKRVCKGADGDAMDHPLPEDAIVVTQSTDGSLSFEVKQEWIDGIAGLAVRTGFDCEIADKVEKGYTFGTFEGECVEGILAATVVVYLGEDFESDKCNACNENDLEHMGVTNFCAYALEIPCETKPVECGDPTTAPSSSPTSAPTDEPSASPSESPTASPTESPSEKPSGSFYPSSEPTDSPTISSAPSSSPSGSPSSKPTGTPTDSPSKGPTATPTSSPSDSPSKGPTAAPTGSPSDSPSKGPTAAPTSSPSDSPSKGPTATPTSSPSDSPSSGPTATPTKSPSDSPSASPTANPTVSMEPTDCSGMREPKIVDHICHEKDLMELPPDAVVIDSETGDKVDVTIFQKWEDAVGVAVRYDSFDSGSGCSVHASVEPGEEFNVQSQCVKGITSATIVVYYDEFDAKECEACEVEDLSTMAGKFCAYSLEISCEPMSVKCGEPSAAPSGSFYPSSEPSESPTKSAAPTNSPTDSPSKGPTAAPTGSPSDSPSKGPTAAPTSSPSDSPSKGPTATPTSSPSDSPSKGPTAAPTGSPSDSPSKGPTAAPTGSPSDSPSKGPTATPTISPSDSPSKGPTATPTSSPSDSPSSGPTATPTSSPSDSPSKGPTATPTTSPTSNPTVSMQPTYTLPDCYEGTRMVVKDSSDLVDMCVYDENMIEILEMGGSYVTITANDVWSGDGVAIPEWLTIYEHSNGIHAIVRHSEGDGFECSHDEGSYKVPKSDIESDDQEKYELICHASTEGDDALMLAVIDVVITDPIICANNNVPHPCGGDTIDESCSWRIVIPCHDEAICTDEPSSSPSDSPSSGPTAAPTGSPSDSPSKGPTAAPTSSPSDSPSSGPTAAPTGSPSDSPSKGPTASPTSSPSDSPSAGPTGSPTSSPSDSPSSGPTATPTGQPSDSPSKGPTASPTATPSVSMEPTNCVEPMPPKLIGSVCKTTGGNFMDVIPPSETAVSIGSIVGDQIGVTVTQDWVDLGGIAIRPGLEESCVVNLKVAKQTEQEMMATCVEGVASVTVLIYLDEEFDPGNCEACNADDLAALGGEFEYKFCEYVYEIECDTRDVDCGEPSAAPSSSYYPSSEPTDSPTVSMSPTSSPTDSPSKSPTASPTGSPSDAPSASPTTSSPSSSPTESCPERTAELLNVDGETMYPEMPIKITMQNVTHVKFEVENTYGVNISGVFTERHAGSFGETECLTDYNVGVDDAPVEFLAYCMHNVKISIVNIWVMDCNETSPILEDSDNAEIPECCHPPDDVCKTVQYTFKLSCIDPCPPDGEATGIDDVRKRHLVDTHALIHEKKAQEASTAEFEELTGHADANDVEDHFCVVEDYPCGADLDKVHVCHYSARDGYKTFCVPEADSDALRFYPKDYCGPCVGGYSTA